MRQIKTISICLSALLFLVGCDDSKPSESRIQEQIENTFSQCPIESIENFQKTNGMLQNDGSYLADVTYTIVMTPSDENRGLYEKYTDLAAQLSNQLSSLRQNYESQLAVEQIKNQECMGLNQTNPTQATACNAELFKQQDALSAQKDQYENLQNRSTALAGQYYYLMSQNVPTQCKVLANGGPETLGTVQKVDVQQQLVLIKTDNGWVLNSQM